MPGEAERQLSFSGVDAQTRLAGLADIVSSTDKATAEEAQHLRILLRDYIIPCHRFALEVAGAHPAMVPALLVSQAQSDANYERLIAGQITWGQFMRDAKAIDAELDAEFDRYISEPQK